MQRLIVPKFLLLIGLSLLACSNRAAATGGPLWELRMNTGMEQTRGTLQWSIGGGSGPDILSELTYGELQFRRFHLNAELAWQQGWLSDNALLLEFSSGEASEGKVQDSDYQGDGRTGEYSRSYSSARGSSMSDLGLGLARQFRLGRGLVVTPMLGVALKQQRMLMTEGVQALDTANPQRVGPFRHSLNSRYEALWRQYWMGLRWGVENAGQHLALDVRALWLDYSAVADWNLRNDFAHPKSFSQGARGSGYSVQLEYRLQISSVASFWLQYYRQDWQTDPGQDRVYFATGGRSDSRLNGVSWQATGVTTGLNLRF